MPRKIIWGEDKIKCFKQLWPKFKANELTQQDMIEAFGVSVHTLINKANELGINDNIPDNYVNNDYLKKIGYTL